MNNIQWPDLLFNLSMSLFGGLVKSLLSKSKIKKLSTYFASAIVGGFAGLLTYLLCQNLDMSPTMIGFATGIAGYMGETILDLFSRVLPKILTGKLQIKLDGDSKENEDEKEETETNSKSKKKNK